MDNIDVYLNELLANEFNYLFQYMSKWSGKQGYTGNILELLKYILNNTDDKLIVLSNIFIIDNIENDDIKDIVLKKKNYMLDKIRANIKG